MRRSILWCVAAIAIGCAPAEEQPAQDQSAAESPAGLADFAGTWTITALAESSDSVLITYELQATSTSEGWTSTISGREPTPVRVVLADGDSVVAEAGPFESALRPGMMVTTRSVARLRGDMLTGTIVARYAGDSADATLTGRLRGVRKAP